MVLSHNSVRYSRATRMLLDAMYEPDVSEKTIRAMLKPSIKSLFLKGVSNNGSVRRESISEILAKPDVNAITVVGETPLHRAIYLKDSGIVALLLDAQANVNIPNQYGLFPLHAAVNTVERIIPSFEEYFKEIVILLLDFHADPNAVDALGNTPLHTAAQKGLQKVACLLIEKGADVNARNKQGFTPLGYAIRGEREILMASVIQVLIEKGADPTMSSDGVKSIFYEACEKQWLHLIQHKNYIYRYQ